MNNSVEDSEQSNGSLASKLQSMHDRLFGSIERALDGWGIQLGARLVFAFTLLVYYLNSATTKLGDGLFGIFVPSANAFAQIVPPIAEHYVYDTSAIPFFPWHMIVIVGTVAEVLLPVLILVGLFTRLAALGMIGFVVVQTFVDVAYHLVKLGGWFNPQASELLDQRVFWVFLLLLLVVKGAGSFSVDGFWRKARSTH
ncbi:MAG: DoxX family protein [Pseudomonadota bacterium]